MKITHLNAQATGHALKRLINGYDRFYWAVAWATETSISNALLQNTAKIAKLVIGTDFDHTSPKLLRALMPVNATHLATSAPGATFHPKVFGFISGQRVAILVGSSNFTHGGTHSNEEASLLLEGTMQDQPLQALLSEVDRWWTAGFPITPAFLEAYERRCAATKQYREALARKLFVPHPKSGAKYPNLLSLSWNEYVAALKANDESSLKRRLDLLHKASGMFANANSFDEIAPLERKALAGFIGSRERDTVPHLSGIDWGWFGSMKGAGMFKNRVNEADPHISAALECISPTGNISEADCGRFFKEFENAFRATGQGAGVATASRLLAMKRPDYFVCVDKENVRSIADCLGFAASTLSFQNYWERVIDPVMTAKWWQVSRPQGIDGRVWDGRTAMLDVLFYAYK